MLTFDYARAWHDLAIPAYNSLPDSLRALWADFQEADREILSERIVNPRMHQDSTLDVVGCPPALRARMEGFSTHDLARAARAIYSAGHWDPGMAGGNFTGKFDKYQTGAHWKFANVCDQILRMRLNRSRESLLEGMIRETFDDGQSWSWFEVCFATEDYETPPRPIRSIRERGKLLYDWRELEAFGARCKAGEFATEDARPWLDLSRFMIEDKGYQGFEVRAKFAAHAEAREARRWAARGVVTV